jgi:hypothetical protein
MEFEEFEKKFKENSKYYEIEYEKNSARTYHFGVGAETKKTLSKDCVVERTVTNYFLSIELFSEGAIDIAKYDTLKKAYEALKGICELNGVEME